uniref:Protein FAR1-RELATED SEQUENCE n=1 Tax=Lactuca sativa TaxID=4236 RepID=A0A9R1VKD3_LACSA|nr:hypothetical protein LSAT_V11C500237300 [Lactuca sativa]
MNMKPAVFEVKWGFLMKEFNLEDTRWYKDMFTKRDSRICGYFIDIPMYGLMKTTSMSYGDHKNVKLVNDSYYSFESCLNIIRDDKKKLTFFVENQQILLKQFESDCTSGGLKNRTDGEVICKLMVVSILIIEEINIHVPQVQSNKGFEIKKRVASVGETTYVNSKKELRMCSECGERVPHNLLTCPVRIAAAESTKDI